MKQWFASTVHHSKTVSPESWKTNGLSPTTAPIIERIPERGEQHRQKKKSQRSAVSLPQVLSLVPISTCVRKRHEAGERTNSKD